jgi:death-on-curing protein
VSVRYLELVDVLRIAAAVNGAVPRDVGLVQSAVARPMTTVFGADAYPDLDTKVAALLHALAHNHPFIDGNKRVAWLAAGAFYYANGVLLDAPDDPAFDLVIDVATGNLDVAAIAAALGQWVRPRP